MTASALDAIPGLGETRRKALLRAFGSVKRVREADVEELTQVRGIGPALASAILTGLAGDRATEPTVNVTTGEVLDD